MSKDPFRQRVEEMLEPCGACCLDDDRDRRRVVDTIVKNLRPKPLILAFYVYAGPNEPDIKQLVGIFDNLEDAKKVQQGGYVRFFELKSLNDYPLYIEEITL